MMRSTTFQSLTPRINDNQSDLALTAAKLTVARRFVQKILTADSCREIVAILLSLAAVQRHEARQILRSKARDGVSSFTRQLGDPESPCLARADRELVVARAPSKTQA